MAAIANLGFAIQAADVGARSIIGLQRAFRNMRGERAERVEEVLRTIETYENAIDSLSSGGATFIAESDQLLRSHITRIVGTMKELATLFVWADPEMQTCAEAIEAQVMDESKWSRFRLLKSELEMHENGLQFLVMNRILRHGIYVSSATDRNSENTKNLPSHGVRPCDVRTPGNLYFVPSAEDANRTVAAHHPSQLPYGFDLARRTSEGDSHCTNHRCLCSCHQLITRSWGYLHLSHTQTRSLRNPCSRSSCKARSLKTTTTVDLSWMKIRLAIITSLEIFWGFGGFSIKPSLDIRRTVPPDSRGFEVSAEFRTGAYSAVQAVEEFRKAFSKGEASLMDVTPDGRTLTESIMEVDSLEAAQESCWDIEYLLRNVAGYSAIMECLPALFKFCETASEFGDIDPFEIVNDLDIVYDVADEDVLGFCRIVYEHEDPFSIKWLQKCLRRCPGFADIPLLIRRILLDDFRAPVREKTVSAQSMNENFLGRSPLHWATCSVSWVRRLLEAGHCVSPVDERGRPPLIYAAAYGLLDSLTALLAAGANPISVFENPNGREICSFLQYAMYHGHPHIVFGSIDFFRRDSNGGFDIAQTLLDQALGISCRDLHYWDASVPSYASSHSEKADIVHKLLNLGANPNIFQSDGSNLLHQSWSLGTRCPSLLLDSGVKRLNVGNRAGETPAMFAAYEANAPLLHLYLHKGARIRMRDNHGRNIVHYAIKLFERDLSWLNPGDLWWRYSTLNIVLSHGADVGVGDHCQCACSVNGCSPSTMLMKQLFSDCKYGFRPSGLALSIEWVLLVQELISYNAAEEVFAEFARFMLFNASGLTHLCCRPEPCWTCWWQESPINQEDISEILDEEHDLITALEEDIETLRSQLGQRDPAEAWADMLVDFAVEYEDLARSSDLANTSFQDALFHYVAETSELLHAVYPDETTYSVRLAERQALIRRCLRKLDSQQASKVDRGERQNWDIAIQWMRFEH